MKTLALNHGGRFKGNEDYGQIISQVFRYGNLIEPTIISVGYDETADIYQAIVTNESIISASELNAITSGVLTIEVIDSGNEWTSTSPNLLNMTIPKYRLLSVPDAKSTIPGIDILKFVNAPASTETKQVLSIIAGKASLTKPVNTGFTYIVEFYDDASPHYNGFSKQVAI